MEKKIINIFITHDSVIHLIEESRFTFKGNNGYWPTACLLSRTNFYKFLEYFWQSRTFDKTQYPIGNSFKIKMLDIDMFFIECHSIDDLHIEFH